ncbi:PD40 domain-containing protein [Streptosporangium fragile]|uniref:PD40 domain-containing protein n=1 Tax=Streptosporangium fragile TaxID=46186 RepID=A0ABN3VRP0_9ACTN
MRARIAVAVVATVVLVGVAVGFAWLSGGARPAAAPSAAPPGAASMGASAARVPAGPGVLARGTADGPEYGRLVVAGPGGRDVLDLSCVRAYAAGGTGVCLREEVDAPGSYETVVFDADLRQTWSSPFAGVPSRARVSASGRMVSWTVFVQGDSYAGTGGFSTRSGVLDTRTGTVVGTLESFAVTLDGRPYEAADVNFWGITFAADDNRFYATMSTGGRPYLVEGDFAARRVRTLRENVECPSLSPDGTRLAFKKPRPGGTWRLAVLDLATMSETPLAETRDVDDQPAWLDDRTVMYGVARDARHADVWAVPADGGGRPRLLVPDAESPAPLR